MSSTTSSETQPDLLNKVLKSGLSRWKLETLTGLLGYRALQHHQHETEKNIAAENSRVRKTLWDETPAQGTEGEDVSNQTILGDYTHPTPIVIAGQSQPSGNGLAGTLAALAIGTLIPGAGLAGYAVSKMLEKPQAVPLQTQQPNDSESIDLGLGRFSDLLPIESGRNAVENGPKTD